MELIRTKSKVLAPGISENIQITATGTNKFKNAIEGPVILWNHRWEYDKNPHAFFKALEALKRKKISFGLIVVGESFKSSPAVFKEMKPLFMDEIIHWGFVESRIEYNNLLAMADLIPICSIQEFFGLSMMEAIQSEIYPILPNRLVYPEHIPGHLKHDYIYDSDEALVLMLENWIKAPKNIHEELISYSKQYLWKNLIIKYDDFFTGVVL